MCILAWICTHECGFTKTSEECGESPGAGVAGSFEPPRTVHAPTPLTLFDRSSPRNISIK